MPNRLIPTLSISCGALTTMYVVLVVTTIFFASWQTEAMSSVRNAESHIGMLEANYYTAISQASSLSPTSLGFVTPVQITYVASAHRASPTLTFARN